MQEFKEENRKKGEGKRWMTGSSGDGVPPVKHEPTPRPPHARGLHPAVMTPPPRKMTYCKQVSPRTRTNHLPSVRTEQRCSHTAQDSSRFLVSHARVCSSNTRRETKREAAAVRGTETQPRGAASGGLQTGGDGAPGVGVPGREHDRELGKGEDKRNAIDIREAQIWEN